MSATTQFRPTSMQQITKETQHNWNEQKRKCFHAELNRRPRHIIYWKYITSAALYQLSYRSCEFNRSTEKWENWINISLNNLSRGWPAWGVAVFRHVPCLHIRIFWNGPAYADPFRAVIVILVPSFLWVMYSSHLVIQEKYLYCIFIKHHIRLAELSLIGHPLW